MCADCLPTNGGLDAPPRIPRRGGAGCRGLEMRDGRKCRKTDALEDQSMSKCITLKSRCLVRVLRRRWSSASWTPASRRHTVHFDFAASFDLSELVRLTCGATGGAPASG